MLLLSLWIGLLSRDLIVLLGEAQHHSYLMEVAITWAFGLMRTSQSIRAFLNLNEDPLCSGCWYLGVLEGSREALRSWGSCWPSSNLSVPSCCISAPTSSMPGKLLAFSVWGLLVVSSRVSIHCRVYEEDGVIGWNVKSEIWGHFVSLCDSSTEGCKGMSFMTIYVWRQHIRCSPTGEHIWEFEEWKKVSG